MTASGTSAVSWRGLARPPLPGHMYFTSGCRDDCHDSQRYHSNEMGAISASSASYALMSMMSSKGQVLCLAGRAAMLRATLCRALVKTWLGLARSESGGPASLFAMAWSLTQSSYPAALQVSYLDTTL